MNVAVPSAIDRSDPRASVSVVTVTKALLQRLIHWAGK